MPQAVAIRLRQLRDEAVEALHLERVTVKLIEKDGVVQHTRHLCGWRVIANGRSVGFLTRARIPCGHRDDAACTEMNGRRQRCRQPDAAVAIPAGLDLHGWKEERKRCGSHD